MKYPKVVPLHGGPVTGLAEVQDDVVTELEWLLEAAKSGELVGLAYSGVHADATTSNRYVGKMTYGSVGGLTAVTARLVALMNDDSD